MLSLIINKKYMTRVRTVILNHLNDAKYDTNEEVMFRRLGFIQLLVFRYTNTDAEISDEQIDELWNLVH